MAAPLFPLTVCFCLGIFTSRAVVYPLSALLVMDCFLLLCSWTLYCLRKAVCFSIAICASFAFLGLTWPTVSELSCSGNHLKYLCKTGKLDLSLPCRLTGICTESKVRRGLGEQMELTVSRIENGLKAFDTSGKVRLALYYAQMPTSSESRPDKAIGNVAGKEERRIPYENSFNFLPVIPVGDEVEVLVNLRLPTNFGNPGQFDYTAYLERQGVYLVGAVKSELLITRLGSGRGNWLNRFVSATRSSLLHAIDQTRDYSDEAKGALKALLLGEKQELSPKTEENFQVTGIYHVLVISGQHVAIMAVSLIWLFRLFPFPVGFRVIFTTFALVFYCLLAGGQSSILRATVMTTTFLISITLDRDRNLINTLSVSALFLLFLNPGWLFDPGFQLSFLAVLAIALFGIPMLSQITKPYRLALRNIERTRARRAFPPQTGGFQDCSSNKDIDY